MFQIHLNVRPTQFYEHYEAGFESEQRRRLEALNLLGDGVQK